MLAVLHLKHQIVFFMTKHLTIAMDQLRASEPCTNSWKYMSRMFPETLRLDELLEKLIADRVAGISTNMVALDWVFWGLRVWTHDPQVAANARVLAQHILQHTQIYVGEQDAYAQLSLPLAGSLLAGTADVADRKRALELRSQYELEDVRPPVYFALGSDVGEFISDLALSAFFYAGAARMDLILHYEDVLLQFAKHDHNQPFKVRS